MMLNVYTEEDAKEKVCPQVIHFLGMKPLINCMAGSCMTWRVLEESVTLRRGAKGWGDKKPMGYCGLAGKP